MSLFRKLGNLIYPPKCPFCGRLLQPDEEGLCARCQRELPWTAGANDPVEFCDICLSPLRYEDGVGRAVHRLKFGSGRAHSVILAELMTQCLRDRWDKPVDGVVWVPMTPKRRRKRGYNQAELLACEVGKRLGVSVLGALEKTRDTATQSGIKRDAARRANVLGAYGVSSGTDLTGRRLLLVDDVTTSGATLSECAFCLRLAGAESVAALTIAKAR